MEGQWPKYDQSAPRPKSSELGSKSEIAAAMDSLHEIHDLSARVLLLEFLQLSSELFGVFRYSSFSWCCFCLFTCTFTFTL